MGRRGAGVAFCFIAALPYAARYVSAAIYGSAASSWGKELFHHLVQYTGDSLTALSIVALAAGVFCLIWAEGRRK